MPKEVQNIQSNSEQAQRQAALISRNRNQTKLYAQNYYLNKSRAEQSFRAWDAHEMSWVWQKFYESERTIAELEKCIKDTPPVDKANELRDWIFYPTKLAALQFEVLRRQMEEWKASYEELGKTEQDRQDYEIAYAHILFDSANSKQKRKLASFNPPKIPASTYAEIFTFKGKSSIVAKSFIHCANALANDALLRCRQIESLKGLDIRNNAAVSEVEVKVNYVIGVKNEILKIRSFYRNVSEYIDAKIDVWEEAVKQVDQVKADFDTIAEYLDLERIIDEKVSSLEDIKDDYTSLGETFDSLFAELNSLYTINVQRFDVIMAAGWCNPLPRKNELKRKLAEYRRIGGYGVTREDTPVNTETVVDQNIGGLDNEN